MNLPVINIGNRQKKRQHAGNVLFVPHDKEAIKNGIELALSNSWFQRQVQNSPCPFGDGRSGERIATILADIPLDSNLLVKDWRF